MASLRHKGRAVKPASTKKRPRDPPVAPDFNAQGLQLPSTFQVSRFDELDERARIQALAVFLRKHQLDPVLVEDVASSPAWVDAVQRALVLGASAAAAGSEGSTKPSSERPTESPAAAAPSSLSERFNAVSELHNNAVFVRQAVKYGFFNFSDFTAQVPTAQAADSENSDFFSDLFRELSRFSGRYSYAAKRIENMKAGTVKVAVNVLKDLSEAEDWEAVSCILLNAPCADPKMRAFQTLLNDKFLVRIYPGVLDVLLKESDIVYVLLGADAAKNGCSVNEALARCEEDPDDEAAIHRRLMMVAWCRGHGLRSVVSDYAEEVEQCKFYLSGSSDDDPDTIPLCSHPALADDRSFPVTPLSFFGKLLPELSRTVPVSIALATKVHSRQFPCWPKYWLDRPYLIASDASWEVLQANDKQFPVRDVVDCRLDEAIGDRLLRGPKTFRMPTTRHTVWLHKGSSVERTAAMLSVAYFCCKESRRYLSICIYLRGCEVFETATPAQRKYLLTGNKHEDCMYVFRSCEDLVLKTIGRVFPMLRLCAASPPENELQFLAVMVDQCESLPGLVYLMAHMMGSRVVLRRFAVANVLYVVSSSDDADVGVPASMGGGVLVPHVARI